jgi:phosphate transport system substrate-binding protein
MYSADITDAAFTVYKIALDGVALVVNPSNPLTNISFEQLERVYNTTAGLTVSGVKLGDQLSNWQEFAITYDHPIVAVSRENGSGTRTCFQDIIKGLTAANGKKYPLASGYDSQAGRTEIASSTDQVREKISGNINAIGYMSLGSVNSSVKKIQYEGITATETNVLNGSYKFARPFNLLTKAGDKLTAVEKEFMKFALSSEGQQIVENSNFISLDNATITAQLAKIP